jgi:hypothetical protein
MAQVGVVIRLRRAAIEPTGRIIYEMDSLYVPEGQTLAFLRPAYAERE